MPLPAESGALQAPPPTIRVESFNFITDPGSNLNPVADALQQRLGQLMANYGEDAKKHVLKRSPPSNTSPADPLAKQPRISTFIPVETTTNQAGSPLPLPAYEAGAPILSSERILNIPKEDEEDESHHFPGRGLVGLTGRRDAASHFTFGMADGLVTINVIPGETANTNTRDVPRRTNAANKAIPLSPDERHPRKSNKAVPNSTTGRFSSHFRGVTKHRLTGRYEAHLQFFATKLTNNWR